MDKNELENAAPAATFGAGAVIGAVTFALYFVGECAALTWRQRVYEPSAIITGANFRMLMLLLGSYSALGAGVGALIGLVAPQLSRRFQDVTLARLVAAGLGVLTMLHIAASQRHDVLLVAGTLLASAVFVLSAVAGGPFTKLRADVNAFSVVAWLTAAPVIAQSVGEHASRPVVALALLALWVVLHGVSVLAARVLRLGLPVQLAFTAFVVASNVVALRIVDRPEAGVFASTPSPANKPKPPNVVLIVLDTVRTDHLSVYGYARRTTPFLTELAKEATLYPEHRGAADLTLPGHASIFTGLYPDKHGAYSHVADGQLYGRPLAARFDTMAELLKSAGYLTAGIVANHGFLGHGFGIQQGFTHYTARVPVSMMPWSSGYYLRSRMRGVLDRFVNTSDFDLLYRRGHEINADVNATLDNLAKAQQPFFLFANYMDAHDPYAPPAPFDSMFPGKARRFRFDAFRDAANDVLSLKRDYAPWEKVHVLSQYDGGIAYLDQCIEGVVAHLRKLGVYDDTMIVVTADHGEAIGEHHLVLHGLGYVYEDQVRVPLVIKYPNQKHGDVFPGLASMVDVLPTVLDVAGVAVPPVVQGQSLKNGVVAQSRAVLSEAAPEREWYELHERFHQMHKALFFGSYKLIRSSGGTTELYDLSSDAAELHDLAKERPQLVAELSRRLEQAVGQPQAAGSGKSADSEIDADAVKRLRALGYVK